MEKEQLDSMVVFDRGVKIPFLNKTIYGFLFDQKWCDDQEEFTERIHKYVEYLSALVCWADEGGTISQDAKTWFKDGQAYPFSSKGGYFTDVYLPDAYAKNPINYQINWECNPKFETEDLDDDFIIKNIIKEQWRR